MASWKTVTLGHLFSLSVLHILVPRGKEEKLIETLVKLGFSQAIPQKKRNAYAWDLKTQNQSMTFWDLKKK